MLTAARGPASRSLSCPGYGTSRATVSNRCSASSRSWLTASAPTQLTSSSRGPTICLASGTCSSSSSSSGSSSNPSNSSCGDGSVRRHNTQGPGRQGPGRGQIAGRGRGTAPGRGGRGGRTGSNSQQDSRAATIAASKQRTEAIKATGSPEQLLLVVQQHAAAFDRINLSTAFTHAARLCRQGMAPQRQPAAVQQLLSQLHQLAAQPALQQQCGARELANIIHSSSKLRRPYTARLLLPLSLQPSRLQEAVPQAVSNTLWAAATLQLELTPAQLQQLLERFTAVLRDANPQAVSNVLWAVATMGQQVPPQQLQQLLDRLTAMLSDAKPQDVSNTLWAVATMGQQVPPQQLQQLLQRLTAALYYAKPQEVSNTLWAVATMGQQVPPQQLHQLLERLTAALHDAKPQEVSNTLWAVATIRPIVPPQQLHQLLQHFIALLPGAKPQEVSNTLWAVATMGQQVPSEQLQQLLDRLTAMLPHAKPQAVSNVLWAVAAMGQQVPPQQLQQLLDRLTAMLSDAKPQDLSNTLWALATMGQQVPPQQLQQLLERFTALLPGAKPQEVSNTLWACGKQQYLPVQLLQQLQHNPRQLAQLLANADAQALANMAWACGQLGYRGKLLPGELLQQAVQLLRQAPGSLPPQELCNLCWSAAVLDLQQCVPQVLQLAAAAGQVFSTASDKDQQQLHQVHMWLLDIQLPSPGQGLAGVLTQQQLKQCRASWEQQLAAVATQQSSRLQQSVFIAVQQLPRSTWQQLPQPEQATDDKACLIDIAAVTDAGVKVAIEVDGPDHFVQPGNTLTGTTQARNRALAARGYAVISIPHWEWRPLRSAGQQQQYLLAQLRDSAV